MTKIVDFRSKNFVANVQDVSNLFGRKLISIATASNVENGTHECTGGPHPHPSVRVMLAVREGAHTVVSFKAAQASDSPDVLKLIKTSNEDVVCVDIASGTSLFDESGTEYVFQSCPHHPMSIRFTSKTS